MKINRNDIQPVGARCLINTLKQSEMTSSGLYNPEKEFEATPVVGTVFKAGTDSKFKEGQIVMFRRYSLDELKFNDDTEEVILSLCEDEEIVAVVTPSVI